MVGGGCGGTIRVTIDTPNVADFSGVYEPYTDFYTALSYINNEPDPSVGADQLYMGATGRGCGTWFLDEAPPSARWDVGYSYYTADGAGW